MGAIPEAVLTILEAVRSEGSFNMLEKDNVIRRALEMEDEQESYTGAALWLYDNPDRYMEALMAMGERRHHG